MLLIGNGKLFTRDEERPYLPDGAVVIDGDTVQEVGSLADMRAKYPAAEFVDARGQIILPGLINAHTHIYSCLLYTSWAPWRSRPPASGGPGTGIPAPGTPLRTPEPGARNRG